MKFYKSKNQLLIILIAVGFFVGILYENIVSKNNGIAMEMFQPYFLKQFLQMKIVAEEYLWYIARARAIPFLLLCILGCLRWKKTVAGIWVAWIGFSTGVVVVSAVIQLGIKGILFCLACLFPHIICYTLAYSVLLLYLFYYPRRQWGGAKTIFVVLTLFLGIVMETYLGPFFIKMAVRMF